MNVYVYLPFAVFYLLLLALALWGAWLGWTRSKSPTARGFVVVLSLVWAGFTLTGAVQTYRQIQDVGVEAFLSGEFERPVVGTSHRCVLCYEGPAGRVYVVAASRIEGGDYRIVSRPGYVRYSVRFDSGRVLLEHEVLEPGCHVGEAKNGTGFVIPEATGFRLEVGDAAGCD